MSIFSCKHVAKAINKSLDEPLSLKEKLSIQMHLVMCQNCRYFKKQMLFLRRATRRFSTLNTYQSDGPQARLSTNSKRRLKNLLHQLGNSEDS
ncbi:zf-HC2 domain-containing protein [Gimesia panareensis]|uniref:Uncharacterized protein n=1 Tax=Gimesia panareensis TaxID=2527978 RepID=A0A518FWA3_9PLAN|nr:hypothetical protein Pan110_46870 [Gimesia panareensis]QDV20601.1 hypothetical protein Pan153_52770 [Gimesia panareensis]